MSWLTTKLAGYAAAVGGVLALVLTIFYKGKSAGKKEVKDAVNAKTTEVFKEVIKDDKEIEKTNRSMSADARRDKLRKYASDNNDK